VISKLVWLYPRRWRERYGDELEELVESLGLTPTNAFDLIGNAFRERMRSAIRRTAGGPSMTDRPGWGSTALALIGFILLAPTLLFIGFSVLIYNIGVPMDGVRSIIDGAVRIGPIDIGLALLPFVALAIALAPVIRLSIARDEGEVVARVVVRPGRARANMAVAALAIVAITVLVTYQVTDRLF
jgi:hypothetical protein